MDRGGGAEEVVVVEGLVLNSDVWEAERRVGWIRTVGGWMVVVVVGGSRTAPRCSAAAQCSGRPTDGHTDTDGAPLSGPSIQLPQNDTK